MSLTSSVPMFVVSVKAVTLGMPGWPGDAEAVTKVAAADEPETPSVLPAAMVAVYCLAGLMVRRPRVCMVYSPPATMPSRRRIWVTALVSVALAICAATSVIVTT